MLSLIVALSVLFILCVVLVFLFPFAVVCGNSMYPTFREGDVLLCRRLLFNKKQRYSVGDIVVFRAPYEESKYLVIKRVSFFVQDSGSTYMYVLGDNSKDSYDSRNYGLVNCNAVVAKVMFRAKRCNHGK